MVWRAYDYTPRFTARGSATFSYRPLLEVDISHGERTRRAKALVDSGTELTIVDLNLAERLGISPEGHKRAVITAFATEREAFLAPVVIAVPGYGDALRTTVLCAPDPEFEIILGQDDFFRRFFVKFEKAKNKFYLDIAG